ncbi:hypothetical protein [Sinorhizobium meliloti]|uniref:HTH araC/xylS-type domain-containing protein n=2 Tax=Rhizobium meliloti TaxID=382 RepID=F7XDL2_SINMM|nr:hypothetical protein [Sinorhizobium meliloti]AEG57750.1 hypothetical protein Sinme_6269 [Sinorhizobium meliloti AK83]AEH81637.1 Hypothetical protein SM11_pC0564 [Sinorhizobium meliloti SM11]AIM01687.1 hypothetical protein DU99_20690 [Sinorhizobium meliloti]ARS66313.1 hypothetical protein SMRU11_02705 [Sinorhizobium meliloti RU11/001]ASP66772.1 hypothetical protein CDO29_19550 [Sinorhizobium meliloti]
MMDLVRSFMGPTWAPLRAMVSGSQIEAKSEAELILGTDLSLSTEAALYFPRHQLDTSRPMRSAQPSSAVSCTRQIGDDLLSCIEHLILLDLLDDRPTIDRMGRRLGMSRRTLQRRLAEQGMSFEATLKAVLERQAEMHARYTGFLDFADCLSTRINRPCALHSSFHGLEGDVSAGMAACLRHSPEGRSKDVTDTE